MFLLFLTHEESQLKGLLKAAQVLVADVMTFLKCRPGFFQHCETTLYYCKAAWPVERSNEMPSQIFQMGYKCKTGVLAPAVEGMLFWRLKGGLNGVTKWSPPKNRLSLYTLFHYSFIIKGRPHIFPMHRAQRDNTLKLMNYENEHKLFIHHLSIQLNILPIFKGHTLKPITVNS